MGPVARGPIRFRSGVTLALLLFASIRGTDASQLDIPGPPGSIEFGRQVAMLGSGRFLVTDPRFGASPPTDSSTALGAVYLYAPDGQLLGSMKGILPGDGVADEVRVLRNGNALILSRGWNHRAGAVTFLGATQSLPANVSAANSLVGGDPDDLVGSNIDELTNGNYVVRTPLWNNGVQNARFGAVTWGSGDTGVAGVVSATNSLVGATMYDYVGDNGRALANGNYIVRSNGAGDATINAGAVTWFNGQGGTVGVISSANSLVGTTSGDTVGAGLITLPNGNYVVISHLWNNGVPNANFGAVTFGNGLTGVSGAITAQNSLVGSTPGDYVGSSILVVLANGNYVVSSSNWHDGANIVGAVTWGSGVTGASGAVSKLNSLVGSADHDFVGIDVTALRNGNYVVGSRLWSGGGASERGAITWVNGSAPTADVVSESNSIVGGAAGDHVGYATVALTNGNYVTAAPEWSNGAVAYAGAVTWGSGTAPSVGVVGAANSQVGSHMYDSVGMTLVALSNGNYVSATRDWSTDSASSVGAATWGNGGGGSVGPVTAANSLVGSWPGDRVGIFGIKPLPNGSYLVVSSSWNNGVDFAEFGALTWGDGAVGITGPVSAANSLVGHAAHDQAGRGGILPLGDDGYLVDSIFWNSDAGAITKGDAVAGTVGVVTALNSLVSVPALGIGNDAFQNLGDGYIAIGSSRWFDGAQVHYGALTIVHRDDPIIGTINAQNSVLGSSTGIGQTLGYSYDSSRRQLVVGRSVDNIVTLWRLDRLSKDGFE